MSAATVPADTRMMGIVHSALRRDLVRVGILLDSSEQFDEPRRRALAEHLLWMMTFLHNHHQAEDDGLYPQVLARKPEASDLLAVMAADHARIDPAVTALDCAAREFRVGLPGARAGLGNAVEKLTAVLIPHLTREEQVMMPVVSATLSDAEWKAWDQEFNIKPKGLRVLADEAHWVLDGLDEDAQRFVQGLVPPVPRFIVLKMLGGRYRRRRTALWSGSAAAEVTSLSIADHEALSAPG